MEHCFTCGGLGFTDKICPECHREPRNNSLNLDMKDNVQELVTKINGVMIPNKYHGVLWSKETLESYHQDKIAKYNEAGYDDLLFQRYTAQLAKINDIFADGRIPHKSAIIIAPPGYSKMIFAYSCMQRALDAGFSVAPLLDTCEVKRLLILASENVRYKLNNFIGYDEYIMADIAFVTITKLHVHIEAYQIIQELLDRRARKGLSTFIISRFGIEEMSKADRANSFSSILNEEKDNYKYPAIIQYRQTRR